MTKINHFLTKDDILLYLKANPVWTRNISNSNVSNRLNPNWITGFSDAEGTFVVSIYKSNDYKCKYAVKPSFAIELHERDINLLHKIKEYFNGVGSIHIRSNKSSAIYTVTGLKDINSTIIPHFIEYPLLTQKKADFLLFKEIIELMNNKYHLTLTGLNKIVSIRAAMNNGLSKDLMLAFPDITPIIRPKIEIVTEFHPFWIVGFCDGESNFDVSIIKSERYTSGYQVQHRFRITQSDRDLLLMRSLIDFFKSGTITESKERNACTFIVSNLKDLTDTIIPFFELHNLQGCKLLDLLDFSKIITLVNSKEHYTPLGLEKIRAIKLNMNTNRKHI